MAWGDHDESKTKEQLLHNIPSQLERIRSDGDYRHGYVEHQNLRNFVFTIFELLEELDHGTLLGLEDDDHPQYSLADGSRAFTGAVSGVAPTLDAHLATKGYVDETAEGVDWQDSVLSRSVSDPSTLTPSEGERWLVPVGAVGDWLGHDDELTEWNGSSWDFVSPQLGFAVTVEDENLPFGRTLIWTGSGWTDFGASHTHDFGFDHEFHVATNGTTVANGATGSLTKPFSTVQEAFDAIAAAGGERNRLELHPGVYTESPTLTLTDQVCCVDFDNALISGDVEVVANATVSFKTHFVMRGTGSGRPMYSSYVNCGISGNFLLNQNVTTSRYVGVHLFGGVGIGGNADAQNSAAIGGILTHLFMAAGAVVKGDLLTTGSHCGWVAYFYNSLSSSSAGWPGVQGNFSPHTLVNGEFTRPVVPTGNVGGASGDWINVTFKAGSDFSALTGVPTFSADAASITSFLANVVPPTAGYSLSYRDKAVGVGNDSSVPGATVKAALDSLLASIVALEAVTAQGWREEALRRISERVYLLPADAVLSTDGASDLQTAIDALSDGEILEIQANGPYGPVALPPDKAITIRVAPGFAPVIQGNGGLRIPDGARDCVISGIRFESYAPFTNLNYTGGAITFGAANSKCSRMVFHRLQLEEATSGSAVLLCYHWSIGGDSYYAPQLPEENSDHIAFVECESYKACKDGNEGAAFALRGFDYAVFHRCRIDGGGVQSRGIQLQSSRYALISKNLCRDFLSNGEGIKVDRIGTTAFRNSATILDNWVVDCVEGVDVDDTTDALVARNVARGCTTGFPLDDSSTGLFIGNKAAGCSNGFHFEAGSVCVAMHNVAFANATNDYLVENGYSLPASNLTTSQPGPTWASEVGDDSSVGAANVAAALSSLIGSSLLPLGGSGVDFDAAVVSPSSPGAVDDSNLGTPFATIQGAIDAFPAPTSGAEELRRSVILVAPGKYDESLVLGPARRWELFSLGPVTLGDGALQYFDSTTPRNVTWNTDSDDEFSQARPTLLLGSIVWGGEASSTHTGYASSWTISGQLIIAASGGSGTTKELHLQGVRCEGGIDGTGDLGGCNAYFYRSYIGGAFNHTGLFLNIAESCEFDGPTTIASVCRCVACEFDGVTTVSAVPNTSLPPNGFFGCDLAGTFSGPAACLLVDLATYKKALDNGLTLAGGATYSVLVAAAAPGTIEPDDAAVEGTSLSLARADHQHAISCGLPGSINIGDLNSEGVSTSFARADHKHSFSAGAAPANVTKSAAQTGTSTSPSRSDHKHDVTTGVPVAVGTANAEGTSSALARADHVHAAYNLPAYGGMDEDQIGGTPTDIDCTIQDDWYPWITADAESLLQGVTFNDDNVNGDYLEVAGPGKYLTSVEANFTGSSAQDFEIGLFKNADANPSLHFHVTASGSKEIGSCNELLALAADDELRVKVRCTSGAAKTFTVHHMEVWTIRLAM